MNQKEINEWKARHGFWQCDKHEDTSLLSKKDGKCWSCNGSRLTASEPVEPRSGSYGDLERLLLDAGLTERQAQALAMSITGYSLGEIAETLGIGKSTAQDLVARAKAAAAKAEGFYEKLKRGGEYA